MGGGARAAADALLWSDAPQAAGGRVVLSDAQLFADRRVGALFQLYPVAHGAAGRSGFNEAFGVREAIGLSLAIATVLVLGMK